MIDARGPDSYHLGDLSDSDTERHPAEALIIKKAEQSSSASMQAPTAGQHDASAAQAGPSESVKQPAVVLAANPALAKFKRPEKAGVKAKKKKRSRDSEALEHATGAHKRRANTAEGGDDEYLGLCSSDSEENGIALGNAPGARGKKQRIVEPVGVRVVEEDEEPVLQASEMQRLLRQPRYFDEDFEEASMRCFRCGGQGHTQYNCPNELRQRPCYLCGQFGHTRGQCPNKHQWLCCLCGELGHSCGQVPNMLCFKCNQPGHISRECPSGRVSPQLLAPVCLRCGRPDCPAAHAGDYVRAEGGCAYEYADEDMAQVRCMLCGRRGHFCCQGTQQLPSLQPSCYNCGEGGHTGDECWRDRPNGVVNERRNTIAAHGGTIVQRSVPALNMDHSYYQGGTTGNAEPLKHGGFGPQYGGTSYQERVSRMQARTGEDRSMRTMYTQSNTHVRFDANGEGTPGPGSGSKARRRYGRR